MSQSLSLLFRKDRPWANRSRCPLQKSDEGKSLSSLLKYATWVIHSFALEKRAIRSKNKTANSQPCIKPGRVQGFIGGRVEPIASRTDPVPPPLCRWEQKEGHYFIFSYKKTQYNGMCYLQDSAEQSNSILMIFDNTNRTASVQYSLFFLLKNGHCRKIFDLFSGQKLYWGPLKWQSHEIILHFFFMNRTHLGPW